MGKDKHISTEYVTLTGLETEHTFYVIPDNFPLKEDGIIGIQFLEKYKFEINNTRLKLNGTEIKLFSEPKVPPLSHFTTSAVIDGKLERVTFINTENEELEPPQILDIDPLDANDRLRLLKQSIRTNHIEPQLRKTIEKIIFGYSDIFTLESDPLPCTRLTEHEIILKDPKPINVRSYRPPECHKNEIKRQIDDMLKKSVIEPSDSPFNSPLWVVPKKLDASGKRKWRIVIDFRKLNEQTEQDAYPLPNIDDILDHLGKSKFFSALNLSSGFHQISMEPNSKKYTGFSTPDGHFQYRRMPFGLKNAPARFQRMMNNAPQGLIGKHCFVYLDDIIIFGTTIEEHNRNLAIVFQRLRETELKLQPDKCEYLKPELEYLGHLITAEGIRPNPSKLEAVKNFKMPGNVTEVKAFLGLTGYYRKFIRNFAKISKPLTELTKNDVPFHWTDRQQIALDILKGKLLEEPILKRPDFLQPFTRTTDASNEGIGAILSQKGHPCCYISRTLIPAETNYTTTEKELLAIVWTVRRLRQHLLGRKFTILTDHKALVCLT